MNDTFDSREKLFRAVYPPTHPGLFWKRDGGLSTSAFADPKGLSVDREGDRTTSEAVSEIRKRLHGCIVSVTAGDCWETDAIVRYLPSKNNPYHSEIHGSETEALLTKVQRFHLASQAVVEYMEPQSS